VSVELIEASSTVLRRDRLDSSKTTPLHSRPRPWSPPADEAEPSFAGEPVRARGSHLGEVSEGLRHQDQDLSDWCAYCAGLTDHAAAARPIIKSNASWTLAHRQPHGLYNRRMGARVGAPRRALQAVPAPFAILMLDFDN